MQISDFLGLLGILVGMLFTATIQSSSASVGILQTLAASGLIGLPSAVYILLGQNIGTCITAVLASIGTNRSAKRTTIIHRLSSTKRTSATPRRSVCSSRSPAISSASATTF